MQSKLETRILWIYLTTTINLTITYLLIIKSSKIINLNTSSSPLTLTLMFPLPFGNFYKTHILMMLLPQDKSSWNWWKSRRKEKSQEWDIVQEFTKTKHVNIILDSSENNNPNIRKTSLRRLRFSQAFTRKLLTSHLHKNLECSSQRKRNNILKYTNNSDLP